MSTTERQLGVSLKVEKQMRSLRALMDKSNRPPWAEVKRVLRTMVDDPQQWDSELEAVQRVLGFKDVVPNILIGRPQQGAFTSLKREILRLIDDEDPSKAKRLQIIMGFGDFTEEEMTFIGGRTEATTMPLREWMAVFMEVFITLGDRVDKPTPMKSSNKPELKRGGKGRERSEGRELAIRTPPPPPPTHTLGDREQLGNRDLGAEVTELAVLVRDLATLVSTLARQSSVIPEQPKETATKKLNFVRQALPEDAVDPKRVSKKSGTYPPLDFLRKEKQRAKDDEAGKNSDSESRHSGASGLSGSQHGERAKGRSKEEEMNNLMKQLKDVTKPRPFEFHISDQSGNPTKKDSKYKGSLLCLSDGRFGKFCFTAERATGKWSPPKLRLLIYDDEGNLIDAADVADPDDLITNYVPKSYRQLDNWLLQTERGFSRRMYNGLPSLTEKQQGYWYKYRDWIKKRTNHLLPGTESNSGAGLDPDNHITVWAVMLRFILFTWNRAMVTDNFELLDVTQLEDDWKHFKGDLAETGSPPKPIMSLRLAMQYLTYCCPTCSTLGMCNELCNNQVATCKRTSALWATKAVSDPKKAEREAAFKVWKDEPARKGTAGLTMAVFLKTAPRELQRPVKQKEDEVVRTDEEFYAALSMRQSLVKAHPAIPLA
jgi:hypothetical protein